MFAMTGWIALFYADWWDGVCEEWGGAFSPGLSGVLVCDAGWDVGGTMDGVLSGGAGGGRYVARQEAVPWGMDADECAGVWGCGVSAGGWLAGGEWLRWFAGGWF